jgi:hypothetical protein
MGMVGLLARVKAETVPDARTPQVCVKWGFFASCFQRSPKYRMAGESTLKTPRSHEILS